MRGFKVSGFQGTGGRVILTVPCLYRAMCVRLVVGGRTGLLFWVELKSPVKTTLHFGGFVLLLFWRGEVNWREGLTLTKESSKSDSHTQIAGTEAEPQQIVAQGLLSCLQYHVP